MRFIEKVYKQLQINHFNTVASFFRSDKAANSSQGKSEKAVNSPQANKERTLGCLWKAYASLSNDKFYDSASAFSAIFPQALGSCSCKIVLAKKSVIRLTYLHINGQHSSQLLL